MSRSLFVLSDGKEIYSGVGAVPAIKACTYTKTAITTTDLDYAAACAASLEVSLIDTSGTFTAQAGDTFQYYEVDNAGTADERRVLMGSFIMELPKKQSVNTYKFNAYDKMSLFDRDMTTWLTGLKAWPYTIRQLLDMACQECGVQLQEGVELINGGHSVMKFLQRMSGRDLIRWVAAANCAFAFMDLEGKLAFKRFDFTNPVAGDAVIKKLTVGDYDTAPISGIAIRQEEDDIGVSAPEEPGKELYVILGNPLLAAFSTEELQPVAEVLAPLVMGNSYTPLDAQLLNTDAELIVDIGDVIRVSDRTGREYISPVFSVSRTGSTVKIKSTGSRSREAPSALTATEQEEIIQGRVARIKVALEEVSASLSQQRINLDSVTQESSAISQKVDSIFSEVSANKTTVDGVVQSVSQVEQKSTSLEIAVGRIETAVTEKADRETVQEFTEHFLFTENGLEIFNTANGMGIGISEKQVAFTGGQDPTTVITPNQMETTRLVVGERLDLGEFSFLPRTNGNLSFRYIGGE